MNKKMLLLFLSFTVNDSNAAEDTDFSAIPHNVQQLARALVDERDTADLRAQKAEMLVGELSKQVEEAKARATQLAADAERRRKQEEALLAFAGDQEEQLLRATEDAERLLRENLQLRKEKIAASAQADDFLQKLQALTDTHETVSCAHRRAQSELERIAKGKQKSDDEVQRLLGQVASLSDTDFRLSGIGGISSSRVSSHFSAMAVLNPQFQKEQEERKAQKKAEREQLQIQLKKALTGQKQMQDAVDEAFAIVREKDQEIKALSVRASELEQERITLEKEQVELQNFKDATKEGYTYLDGDDIAQANAPQVEFSQDAISGRRAHRTLVQSLLERLRRIARAAIDEATN